jgi:hypothetical protein
MPPISRGWAPLADDALLGRETLDVVIEELPAAQRVVTTRLLHRARFRVQTALERHLDG